MFTQHLLKCIYIHIIKIIANNTEDQASDEVHNTQIKELLMKVKKDDGGFDFDKFKNLYTTKYINEELKKE